jgi:hypothetical protein
LCTGLECIYSYTLTEFYELRFDLELFGGTSGFAVFDKFYLTELVYHLYFDIQIAGNLREGF